jgi:hypothetical protein
MDDCDALARLNRDLFAAEEKRWIGRETWDEWLGRVLEDDFSLRRARPDIGRQDRAAMIAWIAAHPVARRQLLPVETLWCAKSLGVIVGPVLMRDDQGAARRYQNIRVFRRHPLRGWQCAYWQVTEEPPS